MRPLASFGVARWHQEPVTRLAFWTETLAVRSSMISVERAEELGLSLQFSRLLSSFFADLDHRLLLLDWPLPRASPHLAFLHELPALAVASSSPWRLSLLPWASSWSTWPSCSSLFGRVPQSSQASSSNSANSPF